MTKYNINEVKVKEAAYRNAISPERMDELQEKIWQLLVMQKKYREKDYSATKLAKEIGVVPRVISAVINTRFHMNYCMYVSKLRIDEAKNILVDKRYQDLHINEVGEMVGFNNRQSFYGAFYRYVGMTPRDYRAQQFTHHPAMVAKRRVAKSA